MKKYFLFIVLLPLTGIAQKTKTPVKAKTAVIKKEDKVVIPVKAADSYLITGNITGYPDGTPVVMLNGNTGAPETNTQVQKNSFTLSGKVTYPDVKLVLINNKPPYIPIFLDNSSVNIKAKADSLEYALVTGSASHNEFMELNGIVMPNQAYFQPGFTDTNAKKPVAEMIKAFVKKYPNSYVAPLAVYRTFQLMGDIDLMESLFNGLSQEVRAGPIGSYVAHQIVEEKSRPALGKIVPDFSLADTTGKMVSLSSFRGQYVLVDFWASWCRPCRMENPNVLASFKKYKDKNYTVLGVSIDRTTQPWIDAIKTDGLTWTHVIDYQASENSIGVKFRITTIPQNLLIDPNGILIARNLRGGDLETKLASLFGN